jgi:hypothetical protein
MTSLADALRTAPTTRRFRPDPVEAFAYAGTWGQAR